MEVHKKPVLTLFADKQRLEVPLFQRQYVWGEQQHWAPLWDDIERKFCQALDGRSDAPNHFLGAMVLDQKRTPSGHVVIRQVIDGQQRLTTLQIFLAAYRDFCRSQHCDALADECDKSLLNVGMMANKDVDIYKVWPTQLDRPQFTDVISAGSRDELIKRYPQRRRPYARKFDPRPQMVEAYLYFFSQLSAFFVGEGDERPQAADHPLEVRVDECFQALRNMLMVVVIDLQADDDPQVIFETLNARGEPLLPADLLRNYIFLRAGRSGLVVEDVYEQYWRGFDDPFWREEISQGRLNRPRSDLFMQHFLSSRQGQDVPIKHLYVEYRHWLERNQPFPNITAELSTLARQREDYRRILAPEKTDVLFRLSQFLQAFDVGTAHPLLLAILATSADDNSLSAVAGVIESYILRRAVCGLPTKNYNKIFLSITRSLNAGESIALSVKNHLLGMTGDSGVWPDDNAFHHAWLTKDAYRLQNTRLVNIFTRLNETFITRKGEMILVENSPSIEHLLPQTWIPEWPLPDGSQGMDMVEAGSASPSDARAATSIKRDALLQTMGNLTMITFELNASQSNSAWPVKRREMAIHSLLPINQKIVTLDVWDEAAIVARGEDLFTRAVQIWQR